jgi:hypothetical protein
MAKSEKVKSKRPAHQDLDAQLAQVPAVAEVPKLPAEEETGEWGGRSCFASEGSGWLAGVWSIGFPSPLKRSCRVGLCMCDAWRVVGHFDVFSLGPDDLDATSDACNLCGSQLAVVCAITAADEISSILSARKKRRKRAEEEVYEKEYTPLDPLDWRAKLLG